MVYIQSPHIGVESCILHLGVGQLRCLSIKEAAKARRLDEQSIDSHVFFFISSNLGSLSIYTNHEKDCYWSNYLLGTIQCLCP